MSTNEYMGKIMAKRKSMNMLRVISVYICIYIYGNIYVDTREIDGIRSSRDLMVCSNNENDIWLHIVNDALFDIERGYSIGDSMRNHHIGIIGRLMIIHEVMLRFFSHKDITPFIPQGLEEMGIEICCYHEIIGLSNSSTTRDTIPCTLDSKIDHIIVHKMGINIADLSPYYPGAYWVYSDGHIIDHIDYPNEIIHDLDNTLDVFSLAGTTKLVFGMKSSRHLKKNFSHSVNQNIFDFTSSQYGARSFELLPIYFAYWQQNISLP